MKLLLYLVCLFSIPVIMGIVSSYRAGQKPHEILHLRLKNFAQQIFTPQLYRHVRSLWMYYGLLIVFILAAVGL